IYTWAATCIGSGLFLYRSLIQRHSIPSSSRSYRSAPRSSAAEGTYSGTVAGASGIRARSVCRHWITRCFHLSLESVTHPVRQRIAVKIAHHLADLLIDHGLLLKPLPGRVCLLAGLSGDPLGLGVRPLLGG